MRGIRLAAHGDIPPNLWRADRSYVMRSTFRTLHEADKQRMAAEFLQKMHWDQRLLQAGIDDPEEPEGRL